MKRLSVLVMFTLMLALALVTSQAFASPAAAVQAKGTGNPHDNNTPAPSATGEVETQGAPSGGPPAGVVPGAKATAHADKHGKPEMVRGLLTAFVPDSSITVQVADGSSMNIGLTPDTKIHVAGPPSAGDTLTTGMQVVVLAFTDSTNALVARMVVAIPGQPERVHRVGTVTTYTAGSSITILAKDGNNYTFSLASDVKILPQDRAGDLKAGALVTIIAPRVPTSAGWTATGIVVHPATP